MYSALGFRFGGLQHPGFLDWDGGHEGEADAATVAAKLPPNAVAASASVKRGRRGCRSGVLKWLLEMVSLPFLRRQGYPLQISGDAGRMPASFGRAVGLEILLHIGCQIAARTLDRDASCVASPLGIAAWPNLGFVSGIDSEASASQQTGIRHL